MSEMKVYEFAKEIGIETLALMDKIREWNLPIKSHMASLDDEMITQIRSQLDAETAPAKAKKKTAKKKTAAKKTAKKAAKKVAKKAVKKAVKKTAAVKKASTTISSSSEPVAKPKSTAAVAKKRVIRRKKVHDPEAIKAREEQERQEAEATAEMISEENRAAAEAVMESSSIEVETSFVSEETEELVASSASEALGSEMDESSEVSEGKEERTSAKPRRNIVGKMDLTKVKSYAKGGNASSAPATAARRKAPEGSEKAGPRNLRTGFVAATPMVPDFPEPSRKRGGDQFGKKAKGVGAANAAGGGREAPVANFVSSDFRKREVIFQPKKKKLPSQDSKQTRITTPAAHKRVVELGGEISVKDLAHQLGVKVPALIGKLMSLGEMVNMNSSVDFDTVSLIAPEYGYEVKKTVLSEDELVSKIIFGNLGAEPVSRPPVVTVMGHVDHGKTTLLDTIRKANVVSGEAGGITQHIGAYKVDIGEGRIVTFLDTPGHAAFTEMRARGANATDIVVIVVAADDGMMPQTLEAINHAKAAEVPVIVAINKMDKAGANPDRIKQQLSEHGLAPEDWGGQTIYCPVSALKGEGIEELIEQILLVTEMEELKANPNRSAEGVVVESKVEKGRGNVATILVQQGTLHKGDYFVVGTTTGRVREIVTDQGTRVDVAYPSDPVSISGMVEVPQAGDKFHVAQSEREAFELAQLRMAIKEAETATPHSKMSLEELFQNVKTEGKSELPIVLKVDVAGSAEAIKGMFAEAGNEEVSVKVVHSGVGGISESDVLLSSAAQGLIIGFNVRPDVKAAALAKERGVEIKCYNIIYELIDDIKKALSGMLSPDVVETALGAAEVREVFSVPKVGTIAGCSVVDGKIARSNLLRLVRDGRVVYEGKVSSLKRFKDDVREVASGYECGIGIENYNDLKVGDMIEAYEMKEVARTLE
ncbi:MAG: translation initiation factor IF-2 [Bdellovibrionales bacterium]|nr:translation initiation factor IF-2 [Bdellovibrionales bacterium]